MPTDGIHDVVDLTLIVNPWQAVVVVVVVFALFIWPSIQAQRSARRIETTLTTNNGGGHVKDQMDRIEKKLDDHLTWSDGFVADIEQRLAQQPPQPKRRRSPFRRRH